MVFAPTSYALADDRAPTDEERAQIEQMLRGEGFTRWDDIELDDGVWEVDDAVGSDGREYDLKLNQQFRITQRDAGLRIASSRARGVVALRKTAGGGVSAG